MGTSFLGADISVESNCAATDECCAYSAELLTHILVERDRNSPDYWSKEPPCVFGAIEMYRLNPLADPNGMPRSFTGAKLLAGSRGAGLSAAICAGVGLILVTCGSVRRLARLRVSAEPFLCDNSARSMRCLGVRLKTHPRSKMTISLDEQTTGTTACDQLPHAYEATFRRT